MKKKNHRCNDFVENVDFEKLNEILKRKGLTKVEVSRKCGYYDGYIGDHVFREKRLNWKVADTLKNVYGISLNEYICKKADESISNDIYEFTIKLDGELLKELALKSVINHISIEDYVRNCVIKEISKGDKA